MENRIYVASLSDYNNGILHGVWIDVNGLDEYDIQEKVDEMLKASPYTEEYGEEAEEWSIHDSEMCGISISESESFEDIAKIAAALEEHGEAFAIGYNHLFGEDIDEAIEHFDDAFVGEVDDFLDYATELFDECYLHDVPESVRYYIDYEKFARDLEHDYTHIDGALFRNNW